MPIILISKLVYIGKVAFVAYVATDMYCKYQEKRKKK